MTADRWWVGQTVKVARDGHGGHEDGVVEKVGRTLVHVRLGHDVERYDKDTGRLHKDYAVGYVFTLDEYEESAARVRLSDLGFRYTGGARNDVIQDFGVAGVNAICATIEKYEPR